MVDQNSQFYAILTNVGAAKQANADALGIPWKITQMGVGDANGADPTPNATQTSLINEWRRAPLNQLKVDDKNSAIIVAEQVIPADVGGKWIREIALYDADGDMVAVANCAPTYKPLLSQGSGRTQVVRMNLVVSSSSNVQLKIDPTVVLATREYVDTAILSVLPKNKAMGSYTKVTVDERGIVQQGANPTTLSGYGIGDAYTKAAVDTALADKASKATTLVGYGITDGLKRGEAGLAATKVASGSVDIVGQPGGFYAIGAGTTSFAQYSSLINLPYVDDRYGSQIGLVFGGAEPKLAFRNCSQPGVWGQTRYAWHDGNFDPAAKADKSTTYSKPETHSVVRATLNAYGLGATNTGSVSSAEQLPGLASGHYYYAADFSPYGSYAFVQRTTYAGNRGFEVANIPYTDRFFGRSCNGDGSWRSPTELAPLMGPSFVGTPTAPTAPKGTNTMQLATTGFVQVELANRLVAGGGVVTRQQPVLASPRTGGAYDSSALVLREAIEAGGSDEREIFAPGLGFHWFGRVAGKLVMDSVGKLKWNGNPLLLGAVASQVEVDAGSNDVNVVTPAKMRFGFAFIKAGSGGSNAIKFPTWLGGFMVQWGVHSANSADAETTVTFPLEFSVIPGLASILTHDGVLAQSTIVPQSRLLTTTGFQSRREDIVNTTSLVAQIRWIAVGF
ncbi:phage tail protein [Pseudomonas soli]|uniref:phage tail protein n=1 Tax=Pseudomonas soli TaxID=1306993 RepID=UPI0021ACD4D5|nr:phage tail protein [Pseudomonas soli]